MYLLHVKKFKSQTISNILILIDDNRAFDILFRLYFYARHLRFQLGTAFAY